MTGKTYAQSEPDISILPARVAGESGIAANGLTQRNALDRATTESVSLCEPMKS